MSFAKSLLYIVYMLQTLICLNVETDQFVYSNLKE